MKKKIWILLLAALTLGAGACTKPLENNGQEQGQQGQTGEEPGLDEETLKVYEYVNTFAFNRMNVYYLWQAEIAKDLEAWKETDEPIEKVRKIRYKDSTGKDIDKWTMVTDDYASFYSSVAGNEKTAGFDFTFYFLDSTHKSLCAVITFVYPGSPADKAGIKRGDTIIQVNGKTIPYPDYTPSYYTLIGGDKFTVGLYGSDKTITIEPVEMYENPVLLTKVFDNGTKKVGYLHYTSFTLDSCTELIKVCSDFKDAGISELIVDLRYNSGGFSLTEQAIASLIGPEDAVNDHRVLSTEVFNSKLTEYYASRGEDINTYFQTEYDFTSGGKNYKFSTAGANVGVKRLYFIIGSGSASASEALIGELSAYMDVVIIGEQSHGKYCSGLMMQAEEFFEENASQLGSVRTAAGKKYAKNWGLYVMYSRFADKNGKTLCMPDGIVPEYEVDDDPLDGYKLGEPGETMLAKALSLCGYKTKAQAARTADDRQTRLQLEEAPIRTDELRPGSGMRIILPQQAGLR